MSALRDLTVWLPALEAQLRDVPPAVDLVEFTGTVGQGSMGGSYRLDGKSPEFGDRTGHDMFDELSTIAMRFEVERVGVILKVQPLRDPRSRPDRATGLHHESW